MASSQKNADWRSAPRRVYSPAFKLKLVQLALQPGASTAQIARIHKVNDNILFRWIRLFQQEGRVTRRRYLVEHHRSDATLIPVCVTDEALVVTPSAHSSPVQPSTCQVTFAHGQLTLTSPSSELLTVLVRELMKGQPS